ncbi:MAG: NAD(P)-dependent oxidoreductase [Streptosporangiaceae bacterium]|jgi:3-hydroxyisobutyrate dehydrogenase/putative dehydrogenase
MRVGWLGLGAMGAPMAACLAGAGHEVIGYDVAPERVGALAAAGGRAAESIAAAVQTADVVAIMVATPGQLEQALFADGGAIGTEGRAGGLPAGTTVMIMATVGPEAVVSAAARLGERGVAVVDAPVSGGVTRAADGDLLIMVSGTGRAIARVRPLLDVLARRAPVVGPSPGDGQRMKLVNQLLCGVHIAAAAEALAFAESLGLEAEQCWQVLRDGAAASFMFDDRGARMVAGEFGEVRSAMDIFVKDMGLVGAAAEEAGALIPLAAAARELYGRGHDLGLGRLDDSALIEVLREGPGGTRP